MGHEQHIRAAAAAAPAAAAVPTSKIAATTETAVSTGLRNVRNIASVTFTEAASTVTVVHAVQEDVGMPTCGLSLYDLRRWRFMWPAPALEPP